MVFTNSNRFAVIYRFACFILIGIFVVACQSLPGAKKPAKKDPVVETQRGDATTEPPLELIPNPYLANKVSVPGKAKQEFARAQAAMQSNNWELAEGILTLMIETFPKLSGPYVNLGLVHWHKQQFDEAERAFRFAIEINPTNMDAYSQLGVLLREQGKFAEAEKVYLQALEVWPHHLDSHKNIGVLYDLYMGRLPEALKHYKMAQRIAPGQDKKLEGWIVDLERRIEAGEN